jgi:hypothetical protein
MAQDFLFAAHGLGRIAALLQVPKNRTPFMVFRRQLNVSLDFSLSFHPAREGHWETPSRASQRGVATNCSH